MSTKASPKNKILDDPKQVLKFVEKYGKQNTIGINYLKKRIATGEFAKMTPRYRHRILSAFINHPALSHNEGRGHGKSTGTQIAHLTDQGWIWVKVKNKKQETKMGEYGNALQRFNDGDQEALEKYKDKYVLDSDGNKLYFLTDESKLKKIHRVGEDKIPIDRRFSERK